MVPRIIRRHVGLAALQAGRRVKSSMPFYQLVDTGRVIIPLHFAWRWRLIFYFFPPLFNTSAVRLTAHAFPDPCAAVWNISAHTTTQFHPVWSRYLQTDSLKEWVRCLGFIANWCFIYHQWDCLHFPPIVLYKRTERTNVLKLVLLLALSCIIKHTNTFHMYLYADDFFSLCLHSTSVSTYIRQWITVCTLIGNHIALFLICMKLNSTHPCLPEISLLICS